MYRINTSRPLAKVISILLLSVAVIGCAKVGRATRVITGEKRAGGDNPQTTDTGTPPISASDLGKQNSQDTTSLWVFGVQSAPDKAAAIGAAGTRGIIDLRTFKPKQYTAVLNKYAQLDMGICLTFRWKAATKDGQKARGADRVDVPPTPDESASKINDLMGFFNTPTAKKLTGKFYVQIYNEISGGPGRFGEKEEDPMFEFAIKLAKRIRKDAPHIKIVSPALTAIEIVEKEDLSGMGRLAKLRKARLLRTIKFGAEYGDAVDIHLHEGSGADADKALKVVRRTLDKYPGGKDTEIVSLEWSCARFENRTDTKAVLQTLNDVWDALNENGVTVAAYGAYWPGKNQKEVYQWKSLVDVNGKPQEPFHSFFTGLSAQEKARAQNNN